MGVFGGAHTELADASPVRAHRQSTPLAQALAATGDRWTLLIVLALSEESVRLSTLRARLPGVSSAVLDQRIRQMVALGLLSRKRFREMPPRVELQLTDSGAALLPVAGALARWGMRHRWSRDAGCKRIDADAVLRQLPALLEEVKLPAGTVEATLHDDESTRRYRFEIIDGRLRIALEGNPAEEPGAATTWIDGDDDGWTIALGPERDYRGISVHGDGGLARRLLDALPR